MRAGPQRTPSPIQHSTVALWRALLISVPGAHVLIVTGSCMYSQPAPIGTPVSSQSQRACPPMESTTHARAGSTGQQGQGGPRGRPPLLHMGHAGSFQLHLDLISMKGNLPIVEGHEQEAQVRPPYGKNARPPSRNGGKPAPRVSPHSSRRPAGRWGRTASEPRFCVHEFPPLLPECCT